MNHNNVIIYQVPNNLLYFILFDGIEILYLG